MDPLTDINMDAFRRQVNALERAEPDESATMVFGLANELRTAYRRALGVRDQDTTQLVNHDHRSTAEVAQIICGHRSHGSRVEVIVNWTTAGAYSDDADWMLRQHQGLVCELRTMIARTHTTAARALPAAQIKPHLPQELTERVAFCTQWVRYLDSYRSSIDASRNLLGAVLVGQHHWDIDRVAEIAETTPSAISAATSAAAHTSPSEADSGMLRELAAMSRAVSHNATRMVRARTEAADRCLAAGLSPQVIAAYGGELAYA
ncbi:hypothetical protein F4553_001391 [Allocatelliglobosispora scoriae]|uniref:Uncharacterized protein n=1 Tax=Allocatelliglobosispora scoriae TaxID=643052 RepID=A0A841BMN4_9ACTN|nr:hypothetical protein [Allocatelliglobosispora scoriae]MBB5868012.1 hypothetical protein [Allocatelliglobosispora scoriae]